MNRPKLFCHPVLALVVFCATFWSCCAASYSYAQESESGTTSRKAREQTQSIVPYDQLNPAAAQKIRKIVQKPSIYRRLPTATISVDHDYYLFLARHPEVIINIWELMGVTEMTADRVAPFKLDTNDGAGTMGEVELVYGTKNLQIFYGEGAYQGTMLPKKLRGKCVIMIQTKYHLDEQGLPATTSQLDIFMKLENVTLGLIAKTLSPLIGPTADHNFVETVNFIQRLNEITVKNGPGVQAMTHRLTNLTPEVAKQFVQLAGLVYDRARAEARRGNFSPPAATQAEQFQQSRSSSTGAPVRTTRPAYSANPYQNGAPANHNISYVRQQPAGYPATRTVPVREVYGEPAATYQRQPTGATRLPVQHRPAQQPFYPTRQSSYAPHQFNR